MYVCPKCVKGDCVRCKNSDTKTKKAYKCNKCGKIIYFKREKQSLIKAQISQYNNRIDEFKKRILELEESI